MTKKNYPPLELTASQSQTLCSIFDTFIAELSPEKTLALVTSIQGKEDCYGINQTQVSNLAKISASSLDVKATVLDFFQNSVEPSKRVDLLRVLDLLATRPGSLLMTGYFQPFHLLSQEQREQVLLSWRKSSMQTFRGLYSSLAGICLFNAYSLTNSPILEAIGYDADKFFETHPDYEPVQHNRIPMMTKEQVTGMTFDVIVVGSGAGGGVVAGELAQAGYSVLVIEKGKYFHPSEMVQEEYQGYRDMYDGGTAFLATNGTTQCLAGSTLGGGTALNYLVSLKPQYFVREEWAKQGLSHFISPQFNKDLERVFDRIGATTENVTMSKTSEKFISGCKQLGYEVERTPVNTGGRAHHCNKCMLGCKAGIKNSTANTWLVDAMNHGARFLDRTIVTRVLTSKGKAIGVECHIHDSTEVTRLMAKHVIVACGSLRTPTLLKNSGLSNKHIGKHLVIQPISMVFGFYDEVIRQNDGPLISNVCNALDNCQGDHYGAKIEEGILLPGGVSNKIPWLGAAEHKSMMMRHKSMVSMLNVVRDKDSVGVVDYDPSSPNPIFSYKVSKHDGTSMVMCIEKNMKIMVTSGARELYSPQPNVDPFKFRDDEESRIDNPRFIKWIETIHKAGALNTPLISVHQLGTCRMGVSPKISAVQPTGETWEIKNLHVADGSVFPTSVGVNPMVTIEAVALHIARNVISSLEPKSRL
ncbi:uncharacterized protein EV154DRAFT_464083 [Mucor mucedo]|uniref:uncharacterized protein n=1 Tax=Mucor mucedo TaxID=29922 RepID=UPI00221E8779|nr:uncharacterized protein EV154DRAFT_464083 [Mucor mucedo]KAI7891517.1 hypothetical protein EV154DRAFT_464083 [Mucor mucedo]